MHCRACATTTCLKKKARSQLTSDIKPSWSHLSRNIAYPMQVHNSMVGQWGLQKCREFLKDPTITDRTITQFIRQCPCCQVMSRLNILTKTHPFTCASYNPFESLHIDHIGPLPVDDKGNSPILVIVCGGNAFSSNFQQN